MQLIVTWSLWQAGAARPGRSYGTCKTYATLTLQGGHVIAYGEEGARFMRRAKRCAAACRFAGHDEGDAVLNAADAHLGGACVESSIALALPAGHTLSSPAGPGHPTLDDDARLGHIEICGDMAQRAVKDIARAPAPLPHHWHRDTGDPWGACPAEGRCR